MSCRSSLRCEARSQPCAIGVCGSIAPWNTISFMSAENTRRTRNRSASRVDDDTNSFARDGPVISVSVLQRRRHEGDAFAERVEGDARFAGERGLGQREVRRVADRAWSISCARSAIRSRRARRTFARMAHLQAARAAACPSRFLALEEIVEELALQFAAVVGVEMRPVLDAVRFEPFVCFDAARMKPSKLPRGCRPWPPQLAAENSGAVTLSHFGERAL